MAKTSKKVKNNLRTDLASKNKTERDNLRKLIRNSELSVSERLAAMEKIQSMPRDTSQIRVVRRCPISGRPRGCLRFFGNLSRMFIREFAAKMYFPGLRKSSS